MKKTKTNEESVYMDKLERRLKAVWSEYIARQDRYGFDDKTKSLKEKYLSLYQSYRRNKKWMQVVSDKQ